MCIRDRDRVQRDILEIIEKKDLFDIFRSRKVLVTGATGLIGSMFIKALHSLGQGAVGRRRHHPVRRRALHERVY